MRTPPHLSLHPPVRPSPIPFATLERLSPFRFRGAHTMPGDPQRLFDRDGFILAPGARRLMREVERRQEMQIGAGSGSMFDTPTGVVFLPKTTDNMAVGRIKCASTTTRWYSVVVQDIDHSTNPPSLRDSRRTGWAHVLAPTPLPQHGDYVLMWEQGETTLQERRDPSGSGLCSPVSPGATELPPESRPSFYYC